MSRVLNNLFAITSILNVFVQGVTHDCLLRNLPGAESFFRLGGRLSDFSAVFGFVELSTHLFVVVLGFELFDALSSASLTLIPSASATSPRTKPVFTRASADSRNPS